MIGPHEGKELELIISGQKHLAVFHDLVSSSNDSNENIIPDKKFLPYVESGDVLRLQRDIWSAKGQEFIRYVLFAAPGHSWRIEAYIYLLENLHSQKIKHHKNNDIFLGMLLGYTPDEIETFLRHQENFLKS